MDLRTALIIVGVCVIAAIFGLSRLAEKKNRMIGQESPSRDWDRENESKTPPEFVASATEENEAVELIADAVDLNDIAFEV